MISKEQYQSYITRAFEVHGFDPRLSEFKTMVDAVSLHVRDYGLPDCLHIGLFCVHIVGCWKIVMREKRIPKNRRVDAAMLLWKRENWGAMYPSDDADLESYLALLGIVNHHYPIDEKSLKIWIVRAFSNSVPAIKKKKIKELMNLLLVHHIGEFGIPNNTTIQIFLDDLAQSLRSVYHKESKIDELYEMMIFDWKKRNWGANAWHD